MAKKKDSYYFQNFIECAEYGCRSAHLLRDIMKNYRIDEVRARLDEMHKLEHSADTLKHKMLDELVKAFITPIEREDIIQMSHNIDEMSDQIEDVLIRIYYNRIEKIRPDALEMVEIVIKCFDEVLELLREFENFKRSKDIHERIIKINTCEEEADKLFISCMYSLHAESDVREIIAWREIYSYLEKCADTGEHIADVVESVVMKNS